MHCPGNPSNWPSACPAPPPIRDLQLTQFNLLSCILYNFCNVHEPFHQCICLLAISIKCTNASQFLLIANKKGTIQNHRFYKLCPPQLLGRICSKYRASIFGEQMKIYVEQIYKLTRWKHIFAVLMYVCHENTSLKVKQVLLSISLKAALACKHQFPACFWTEWIKLCWVSLSSTTEALLSQNKNSGSL